MQSLQPKTIESLAKKDRVGQGGISPPKPLNSFGFSKTQIINLAVAIPRVSNAQIDN